MFAEKVRKGIVSIYFFTVAVLMYYMLNEVLRLRVYITYRHLFALVLIASCFLYFLVEPRLFRGSVAAKSAFMFSVPVFITITVSLLIWCIEKTDFDMISRGLSYLLIYMSPLSAAFAGAVFLYLFGERGIWVNLLAILTANLIMIGTIMKDYGAANYFREFFDMLFTFSSEAGEIVSNAEIHELAFCTGVYSCYMLIVFKKKPWFILLLILNLFCFLSAYKRIAIVALAIVIPLGWLLRWGAKRGFSNMVKWTINILFTASIVFLVLYIFLVRSGAFDILEAIGIPTMGRARLYAQVQPFYDFSPAYLGHGTGFLVYQLNERVTLSQSMIHNDFLQYYIDLGFWGYLIWLFSMTILRVQYFGRGGKIHTRIVVFTLVLYMLIVSCTDNTLNYQLFHTAVAVIVMGHGFDERVKEEEENFSKEVEA